MHLEEISAWLDYVDSGQVNPELQQAETLLGRQRLRVLLIKILGWIKAKARQASSSALNHNHEWVMNLKTFITECEPSNRVVVISGDVLDFDSSVTSAQRDFIIALVDKRFEPPLMQ